MKADKERLYKHVEFLTGILPPRNSENVDSLEKAAGYIGDTLASCGYAPGDQWWEAGGKRYRNVIARWRPDLPKRLVVGAHYDVCGDTPGADDNASAVAGLLETARLLSLENPDLDYGIDFVAYCLEEPPYFSGDKMGSYVHAKSLKESNAEVIGMICYEMIGYFSDKPGSQKFPSPELGALYPDAGNFIVVVGVSKSKRFSRQVHERMKEDARIGVESIVFPDAESLAHLSDQINYWKFGYDAVMINDTSFMRNPNYHELSDTIDTLDFDKMAEVVNCSYRAVRGLGSP